MLGTLNTYVKFWRWWFVFSLSKCPSLNFCNTYIILLFTYRYNEHQIKYNSIWFQWSWAIISPRINYQNIWLTFITTTRMYKDLCNHLILMVTVNIMFIVNYLVRYSSWYTVLTCTATHTFYCIKGITGYVHYTANFLCLTALHY